MAEEDAEPVFVVAHVNARLMPMDRGDRYEDPLAEALAESGFGEVTGGGSILSKVGEIEGCDIDLDLHDLEHGLPFVTKWLTGPWCAQRLMAGV